MANDKTTRKKRLRSKSNSCSSSGRSTKKRRVEKPNPEFAIEKSKQLQAKLKNAKRNNSKTDIPKLFANGKPMPSLSELEKMFEDSDDESKPTVKYNNNDSGINEQTIAAGLQTPKQETSEVKVLSPETIEKIGEKLLKTVSEIKDINDIIVIDEPVGPVIPVKRPKKSGIPYIVGCKDRPQVINKPTSKFCVGEVYGITSETNGFNEENETPKGRRRGRSGAVNISKSIFNAQSEEIAAKLRQRSNSNDSTDSNKTVAYQYYRSPSCENKLQSFSPLPSTSRNDEVFLKNDYLFSSSLEEKDLANNSQSDVELVDTPIETIEINDDYIETNPQDIPKDVVLINIDADEVEDIEVTFTKDKQDQSATEDVVFDKFTDLQNFDATLESVNNIDIDDLIAETTAICEKYRKRFDLNTVTSVEPVLAKEKIVIENQTPITNINVVCTCLTTIDQNFTEGILRKINTLYTKYPNAKRLSDIDLPLPITNQYNEFTQRFKDKGLAVCSKDHVCINLIEISNKLRDWMTKLNLLRQLLMIKALTEDNTKHSCDCGCTAINDIISIAISIYEDNKSKDSTKIDNSLNQSTISPRRSLNYGDCPICMDSFAGKEIASTICGHVFCFVCIKRAIKSNGRKCPTCRKQLKGKSPFHRLYLI